MALIASEAKKISEYWSSQHVWQPSKITQWLQLPAVQQRIAQKISGKPTVDWLDYVSGEYYAGRLPVARCLSLGCGEGDLERRLAANNFFVECDAYDIAEGAIAQAHEEALRLNIQGINYIAADINTTHLHTSQYDAVFVYSALHHFANLEHVLHQVRDALKPGGLLIINEYTGPDRFQFPQQQMAVLNNTLKLLPLSFRRLWEDDRAIHPGSKGSPQAATSTIAAATHWLRRGMKKASSGQLWSALRRKARAWHFRRYASPDNANYKLEIARPTVSDVVDLDPSEAIHSSQIIPLLRDTFEIIEHKGYGGSLLHFLLGGIAGNFAMETSEAKAMLTMLFQIEDSLIEAGELEHDFTFIVARAGTRA